MDTSAEGTCTAENSIALSLRLSSALSNNSNKAPVDLEDFASVMNAGCGSGDGDCGRANGEGCCSGKDKKAPEKLLCYSCRWMLDEVVNHVYLIRFIARRSKYVLMAFTFYRETGVYSPNI